jgi:hypothetical protein
VIDSVLMDQAVEQTDLARYVLGKLDRRSAIVYISRCLDGDCRVIDKGLKWLELLNYSSCISVAEHGYWTSALLEALIRKGSRAIAYPTREFEAWTESDIGGRDYSRRIYILSYGVNTKMGLCLYHLSRLGIPLDLVTIIEIAEQFILNKPYSVGVSAWYPSEGSMPKFDSALLEKVAFVKVTCVHEIVDFGRDAGALLILGAPLLPRSFVEAFGRPILNGHNGPLPYVRGLDSPAWCVLTGRYFSCSVHAIDCDIDCGKLLFRRNIRNGVKANFTEALARDLALAAVGLARGISTELGTDLPRTRNCYYSPMSLSARPIVTQLACSP